MTADPNLFHSNEDSFMLAVDRLEAGEALETILADFPEQEREELRDLLTMVAATHYLQEAEIPRPSAGRRQANKRAFLQAAAEMNPAASNATNTAAIAISGTNPAIEETVAAIPPSPRGNNSSGRVSTPTPTVGEWLLRFWQELQQSLTPSMRLAPLGILLVVIWLVTSQAVVYAQGSLPGDVIYSAKMWMLYQELALTQTENKRTVINKIAETVNDDLIKAAMRAQEQQRGQSDQQQEIIRQEILLVFQGTVREYLHVGNFYVMTEYQPDPTKDEWVGIEMPQIPGQDVQVRLVYQIVPSANTDLELDGNAIVQGISLHIVEDGVELPPPPTPEPSEVVTPTPVPTDTPVGCAVFQPTGWGSYVVVRGDTLSSIAVRSGSTVNELARVNCIANPNNIVSGGILYVPRRPAPPTPVPPTRVPTRATTPTPIVTMTSVTTPNVDLLLTLTTMSTAAPTPSPLAEETVIAAGTITATVTAAMTADATAVAPITTTVTAPSPTASGQPDVTVTAIATITGTVAPPVATPTPTAASGVTVTATTEVEPVITTTATATTAATEEAAPTTIATVTPSPTAMPTTADTAGTTQPQTPTATTSSETPIPTVEGETATATPDTVGGEADQSGGDGAEDEVGGASDNDESGTTPVPSATNVVEEETQSPPTPTTAAEVATTAPTAAEPTAVPTAVVPPTPTPISQSPLSGG